MNPPLLRHDDFEITLPMPLFLVVEDVGWWQGRDGSPQHEPYRTGMTRRHCLADYRVLAALAQRLAMRIQMAMVLCEWDRTDMLRQVPSATWLGAKWNNAGNRGPWLEEAADFLRRHRQHLEIGLHGVGHEYWVQGRLQRAEFHDGAGIMRPPDVVRRHLEAFGLLQEQHGLGPFPQSFVPPALHHSFGNGGASMQGILGEFGVRYLCTIFSRARQYAPPHHEGLTWECGVVLIERGEAAVPWHRIGAALPRCINGPVVSLHWGNLLHHDPERNEEVIGPWVDLLLAKANELETFMAPDTSTCWNQYGHHCLAEIRVHGPGVEIDRRRLPDLAALSGPLYVKVRERHRRSWEVRGGKIAASRIQGDGLTLYAIQPSPNQKCLYFGPCAERTSS